MKVEDNIINEIFKDLLNKSNYQKRKRKVIEFNKKNTIYQGIPKSIRNYYFFKKEESKSCNCNI